MEHPNILLVVLDSLRAKNTSLYGYNRETTPFLSAYGGQATIYRQARSPSIHSVASHASMWTGHHVEEHQAIHHESTVDPDLTVWSDLQEEGYDTGLFTKNTIVGQTSNLAAPFETTVTDRLGNYRGDLHFDALDPYEEQVDGGAVDLLRVSREHDKTTKSLFNAVQYLSQEVRDGIFGPRTKSPALINRFLDWQAETDGPWAACLNLMDTHLPYTPKPEFDKWGGEDILEIQGSIEDVPSKEFIDGRPWWHLEVLEHLYDGTILEVDHYVETLIDGLEKTGEHEDTLVVITSDHGEGFGEVSRLTNSTRMVDHSWGIHELLTHVPLIVKYPGQTKSKEINALATLTEFPTAVQETISGEGRQDSFVPDEPVVSSTYRLKPEDKDIFSWNQGEPDDYVGPWRAVYEDRDGIVSKYIQKHDESATVGVHNAQHSYLISEDDEGKVESVFRSIEPRDISGSSKESPSDDVEDRLNQLGYLT